MRLPRGPIWRVVLAACQVGLLLAVPVLAYRGFDAVLDTTDGRVVDPELDPTEPGYEAFIGSTPTLAVLGAAPDATLSWAAVLALSGSSGGGAIVLVPVATQVPEFAPDPDTVAERFAAGGPEGARSALSDVLDVAVDEVVELGPDRVAGLLRPVAPLAITNVDPVGDFPAGQLALEAVDAARYLIAAGAEESDLTRLTRHEAFWRSWMEAVGASTDPGAVPGETSSGIGRFVRELASGPITVDLPVVHPAPGEGQREFVLDWDATRDLAESRIPFPAAVAPGRRIRVRVIDGVGADGLALRAGRDAVAAGGQLVAIGNADRFDAAVTRVVYFDDDAADRAEILAQQFGVEAEQLEGANPDATLDATVVAGADLLSAYGLTVRETTIGDDAG